MQIFWELDEPVCISEVLKLATNATWKPSYIHLLMNSLLEKNALEVVGMVKSGKNYARTFKYAITPGEYSLMQIKKNFNNSKTHSMSNLFSALIKEDLESDDNGKLIEELEEIIKQTKEDGKGE